MPLRNKTLVASLSWLRVESLLALLYLSLLYKITGRLNTTNTSSLKKRLTERSSAEFRSIPQIH